MGCSNLDRMRTIDAVKSQHVVFAPLELGYSFAWSVQRLRSAAGISQAIQSFIGLVHSCSRLLKWIARLPSKRVAELRVNGLWTLFSLPSVKRGNFHFHFKTGSLGPYKRATKNKGPAGAGNQFETLPIHGFSLWT